MTRRENIKKKKIDWGQFQYRLYILQEKIIYDFLLLLFLSPAPPMKILLSEIFKKIGRSSVLYVGVSYILHDYVLTYLLYATVSTGHFTQ